MDIEEFRTRGKEMIDYICTYVNGIEGRRVTPNVEPGYLRPLLPATAPQDSDSWEDIMADVEGKIMPGVTHWRHPKFHAYFPSGCSFPSILGDMLSNAIGCIGFSWAASPACTELETIVLDWLGKAIGLPNAFIASSKGSLGGGVLQTSASECILVSMLAARNQAINYLQNVTDGNEAEPSTFLPQLVAYCSKEAHSCVEKAAKILLVRLRILEPDDTGSMRGATVKAAMEEDRAAGLWPFFVSATLGSTGSCSFDPLHELGPICRAEPTLWLHVDAAYAGSAFICPEFKPLLAGIEHCDSFNTNTNKWLLTNFDCSCLWVRSRYRLTSALAVDPLYLQHGYADATIDYRHWGIPLSRRFRALKLWFVLRSYGIAGLRAYIRNHCMLAKHFERLVGGDGRFQVVNDVRLGLVCFRLRNSTDQANQQLLADINASGALHMIPSMVRNQYVIRWCVTQEDATVADVASSWELIRKHADNLVQTPAKSRAAALTRQKSRHFSLVRTVSKVIYQRTLSKQNLGDGATPILIANEEEDEDEEDQGGNDVKEQNVDTEVAKNIEPIENKEVKLDPNENGIRCDSGESSDDDVFDLSNLPMPLKVTNEILCNVAS